MARYAVTILRDPVDVYRFWKDLRNLPQFSRHLREVVPTGDNLSTWTADGPNGPVTWTARITEDIENERIAWEALPESDVKNQGRVEFKEAPGNRGTELCASIAFDAPGGAFGVWIAKMTGNEPEQEVAETLRRCKCILECGELPVVEGQPSEKMRSSSAVGSESRKVGMR